MNTISAIVLAAGESRRMGGANKLLLPVGGVPALRRVVETLTAGGLQEIVVVLGYQRELLAPLLDGLDVRTVFNERFRDGQMTSVWAGMSALSRPCDGVMICLGDQPLLTPSDLMALIAAFAEIGDRSILVPIYLGQR
ncbi:MAG: nucleotidyltransferase family protein, partial [Deltaproteobacteria bacterium]|nr:nucleotidyltransferase family protein [Deltaproteobacteria bacterium]